MLAFAKVSVQASLLVAVIAVSLALPTEALSAPRKTGWRPLWNGKDLSGWETYLAPVEKGTPPLGVDVDPHGVFTVVQADGAPAIRISGQIWGALTSKEEFGNYHLRIEFKWGEKRWPPRETVVRDSGILYHAVGPHGAHSAAWMQSLESQVQEHDCGDFWSVGGVIVDVTARRKNPAAPKSHLLYDPKEPRLTGIAERIIKRADHEKPTGSWNVMEIMAVGDTSVHLVNGKVVMVLEKLRRKVDGSEVPLTRGRLQLQSEGAEVFYRRPEVRPLSKLPALR